MPLCYYGGMIGKLFERFEDFRAGHRGMFISPVWDSGSVSHGVAMLPHASTWNRHGSLCEVVIEPLRLLTPDELAALPQVPSPCWQPGSGNDIDLGPYRGQHFVYLPQQLPVCSIGRTPTIERYTGYLCRIGVGDIKLQSVDGRELARFLQQG